MSISSRIPYISRHQVAVQQASKIIYHKLARRAKLGPEVGRNRRVLSRRGRDLSDSKKLPCKGYTYSEIRAVRIAEVRGPSKDPVGARDDPRLYRSPENSPAYYLGNANWGEDLLSVALRWSLGLLGRGGGIPGMPREFWGLGLGNGSYEYHYVAWLNVYVYTELYQPPSSTHRSNINSRNLANFVYNCSPTCFCLPLNVVHFSFSLYHRKMPYEAFFYTIMKKG